MGTSSNFHVVAAPYEGLHAADEIEASRRLCRHSSIFFPGPLGTPDESRHVGQTRRKRRWASGNVANRRQHPPPLCFAALPPPCSVTFLSLTVGFVFRGERAVLSLLTAVFPPPPLCPELSGKAEPLPLLFIVSSSLHHFGEKRPFRECRRFPKKGVAPLLA